MVLNILKFHTVLLESQRYLVFGLFDHELLFSNLLFSIVKFSEFTSLFLYQVGHAIQILGLVENFLPEHNCFVSHLTTFRFNPVQIFLHFVQLLSIVLYLPFGNLALRLGLEVGNLYVLYSCVVLVFHGGEISHGHKVFRLQFCFLGL